MATLTNKDLGVLIGLTHSSVSRIRSGHRLPSPDAMLRIEECLGWPVADQVRARTPEGKYAKEFERVISEYSASTGVPG